MIALVKQAKTKTPAWHEGFLQMVPVIHRYAQRAFARLSAEARDDAVQEVLASAMVAYARLFERGKTEVAYPSVLAGYAVAQYRSGRRLGCRMNCKDVLSPYAQRKKSLHVERLDHDGDEDSGWREVLVEDKHAGPAETAACRIDFAPCAKVVAIRPSRRDKLANQSRFTTASRCRR